VEAEMLDGTAPRTTRQSGFTLVEIVSAVALLSIGLLAVLSASRAARDTQRRAVLLSLGRGIAQSKIEELRAAPFDSLAAMAGTTTDPSLPRGNQIVVTLSKYPEATENNMYQATVVVSWAGEQGARSVRYDTLITRK
jgi:prepilin-type N-terminal cleavage/methylation domain-containing protein